MQCSGDPAGDPLAELDAKLVGRLVVELADEAPHRHREQPAVRLEPVDADVVVLDELVQLVGDGRADLMLAGEAGEPCSELLDRLEVRRPRRHPPVVLGVLDRRRRLGREAAEGRQLLLGPGMGPVVVDDQEPEEIVAVVERRGADRVEPLLHDRRPEVGRPRVVAVAHGEEREAGRRGFGRQGGNREVPDRRQVRVGEAPRDLGGDVAVGAPEEDRRAIAAEQDPRVVDDAGEDLPEVELAPDVGRDPAECLGPVKLRGRLLAQALRVDGDAQLAGHRHEEGLQLGDRRRRRVVRRHEDAPRQASGARDGDGDP